ncbi:MAG: DUF433 domain-containing protein [Blastocatellia bacterium]
MNLLDRITIDPEICHGKPTIRGLRYDQAVALGLEDRIRTGKASNSRNLTGTGRIGKASNTGNQKASK